MRRSIAVLATLLFASCSTSEPLEAGRAAPTTERECIDTGPERSTHRYVDRPGTRAERTSLDIHHPGGCEPVPVVVWLHGGGWSVGDKRGGSIEQKVELAAGIGAALVAVNYRLSAPGAGVQWPDHGDDVAEAIAWIHRMGPDHGLDPQRTALIGHSAGAHLASIVATDRALLERAGLSTGEIGCVIALDSAAFRLAGSPAEASGLVANAFGTDPHTVDSASPLVRVEEDGPPDSAFLVVARGSPRRVESQREFVDTVVEAGGSAELFVADPHDHAGVNRRLGAEGERFLTDPVTRFLGECLG